MRLRNILILLAVLLVIGGFFYFSRVPQPPPEPPPKLYVWSLNMDDIQHITINLPTENKSQSFVELPDRTWHFDDANKTPVDMQRWGGGIPLLLSGPAANRVLVRDATPTELTRYGLASPQMVVDLTLKDGTPVTIKIGDKTPDGNNHYVQAPDSTDVATVDYTWFDVISRLVNEPPYVSANATATAKP